jgi:hypothetical protein
MNKFQELFQNSNNNPITYKGKKLYLADYIEVNKNDVLIVRVLSTNTNRTQSFFIQVDDLKKKKYLEVKGGKFNALPFHESVIPKEGAKITIREDNVKLKVWNRGSFIWAWPMIVEQKENKRIYYCNGEDPEEKLDDLVFEIEMIKAKE